MHTYHPLRVAKKDVKQHDDGMQMCAGLMLDMVWMGGVRDNELIPCALTSMPHLHATPSLLSKVTIDFGTWPMSLHDKCLGHLQLQSTSDFAF